MFSNYAEFSKDDFHYLYDYYEDLLVHDEFVLTKINDVQITKEDLDSFLDREVFTIKFKDYAFLSIKDNHSSINLQKKIVIILEAIEDPVNSEIIFTQSSLKSSLELNIPLIIAIKYHNKYAVYYIELSENTAYIASDIIEQEKSTNLMNATLKYLFNKEINNISKIIFIPKSCFATLFKLKVLDVDYKMYAWVFWLYFNSLTETDYNLDEVCEEFKQRLFCNLYKSFLEYYQNLQRIECIPRLLS